MLLVPLLEADIKNIAYEYEKILQSNILDNSEIYMFSENYYSTIELFEEKIDFRRVAALVMDEDIYLKSSQQQRADFINVLKPIYLNTLGEVTIGVLNNHKLISVTYSESTSILKMVFKNNKREIPVIILYRKNGSSKPDILNMLFNGVNLGLTFRNYFQNYYSVNNGDISKTINDFELQALVSPKLTEPKKPSLLGIVLKQAMKDYPQAKLNARLRKEAYNKGVNDAYRRNRKNGGVAPLPKQEPSSVN